MPITPGVTGDAITAALRSIEGKAPAAIVLLSDGKSVRGSDPLEAAQAAKEFVTRGIERRLSSAAPFDVVWQGGQR